MGLTDDALPPDTALEPAFADGASFTDSHRVPLIRRDQDVVDIFFAVFGFHPGWLKALLLIRHRIGAWLGLGAASTAEVLHPRRAASYRVGQRIGPWPLFHLSDGELIAGRDNRHLDFRLSVLKQGSVPNATVVISTVCRTHNAFGRVYLRAVAPFHRWGMRRLLARAVRAGRL